MLYTYRYSGTRAGYVCYKPATPSPHGIVTVMSAASGISDGNLKGIKS